MKKRFKNLLFYITIVLCVMISFGCLSINSKAAQTSGTLTNGYSFNLAFNAPGNEMIFFIKGLRNSIIRSIKYLLSLKMGLSRDSPIIFYSAAL